MLIKVKIIAGENATLIAPDAAKIRTDTEDFDRCEIISSASAVLMSNSLCLRWMLVHGSSSLEVLNLSIMKYLNLFSVWPNGTS